MEKEKLELLISTADSEIIWEAIKEYEKENSKDFELYSYYVAYYLKINQIDKALLKAQEAVLKNPFAIEANYNYATCLEMSGDIVAAYDYYIRTFFLQEKYEKELVNKNELNQHVEKLYQTGQERKEWKENINLVDIRHQYAIRDLFKSYDLNVIGEAIVDNSKQEYYVGRCDSWFEAYFAKERNKDAFTAKCEIFPVAKVGTEFEVDMQGEEVLVPVVLNYKESETGNNCIIDICKTRDEGYYENAYGKYSYLPVSEKAHFACYKPAVFGKPISLKQKDEKNKKLVLNIFIDSFNAKVIKEYGLKNIMPNTYRFFEKGVMCDNYYSCSEYTLPSIATYWTGRYPSKHMNLDNDFRWDFMGERKVFSEYFKEAGYVTAKIGGNDAVTPIQGYIRGMDRFVYQYSSQGYSVKEVVSDAIENMETFKETNQFIWLDIVDLHDVAGGFMRSLGVQSGVSLQERCIDNDITTTVKQGRSYNREKIYLKELKHIDLYLSMLYQYITNEYKDSEIIVSLFSDHGTAFMVDNDEPFVSEQRTNIPLMIRSGEVKHGVCDEIIETTDYAGIICKLSGLDYDYQDKDANLPVWFGGKKEKEFAISQNIFCGDPYRVGIHEKKRHIYLETKQMVAPEFRINMQDSQIWMIDENGHKITDFEDAEKYKEKIMDVVAHLIQY